MRGLIRYGAPGIALLAGAAVLWTWHAQEPAATRPMLASPPTVVAAPAPAQTPTIAPVSASGGAAPATALPTATSNATAPAGPAAIPPATARPAASFDVVRVNPQGNAVIAGRAVPNADVVALDGDTVIGRATADKQGEWVILPTTALQPGPHTLRLDAPAASNQPAAAASEVVSITVPAPSGGMVAALPAVTTPAIAPSSMPAVLAAKPGSDEAVEVLPGNDKVRQDKVARDELAQEQAALDKSLTVQPGNSLWRIARRSYGVGGRYAVIYNANRERISNPDLIYPGQTFTLPAAN